MRQAGESLLGRVETVDVGGFDVQELTQHAGAYSDEAITRLWLRGGFPLAYLANTDADSAAWRENIRLDGLMKLPLASRANARKSMRR